MDNQPSAQGSLANDWISAPVPVVSEQVEAQVRGHEFQMVGYRFILEGSVDGQGWKAIATADCAGSGTGCLSIPASTKDCAFVRVRAKQVTPCGPFGSSVQLKFEGQ